MSDRSELPTNQDPTDENEFEHIGGRISGAFLFGAFFGLIGWIAANLLDQSTAISYVSAGLFSVPGALAGWYWGRITVTLLFGFTLHL